MRRQRKQSISIVLSPAKSWYLCEDRDGGNSVTLSESVVTGIKHVCKVTKVRWSRSIILKPSSDALVFRSF
jgi:hypothetical protein